MAEEEDYEGWRKLGVPRGMVDEYKADPDRPFRMEDPPDELVERTVEGCVEELCRRHKQRRERVRFLRRLGLFPAFIEEILSLDESPTKVEPMSDEKFDEIMKGSWTRIKEQYEIRRNKVYTEEEIQKIESNHGSREIVEAHNRRVLRRQAREAYWQAVKYLALHAPERNHSHCVLPGRRCHPPVSIV